MPLPRKIYPGNFKHYGLIIDRLAKKTKYKNKSIFSIVFTEPNVKGWRIAHLLLRDKAADYLERHVDSFESFEPLKGRILLFVAKRKDPKRIRCFYLNRPVILKKGIWHNVVTLAKESEIKITENAQVECGYWRLGFSLKAV